MKTNSIYLFPCPSCKTVGKKEYMPKLYKNRLLNINKWMVECPICGMEITFKTQTEQETADLWNKLPRK